jgi:hypothetical protein
LRDLGDVHGADLSMVWVDREGIIRRLSRRRRDVGEKTPAVSASALCDKPGAEAGPTRESAGSGLPDQPEDQKNQHGAQNGTYPADGTAHAQRAGNEAADEGTGDAENRRENEAAPVRAGHEELGDDADDEADDDRDDDIDDFPLRIFGEWRKADAVNEFNPCPRAFP